ncbi:hypothetical protein ACOME3_004044 [Neoechinorhynchus agilis]
MNGLIEDVDNKHPDLYDIVNEWVTKSTVEWEKAEGDSPSAFITAVDARSLAKLLVDIDRYFLSKINPVDLYDFAWIVSRDDFTAADIPPVVAWLKYSEFMSRLFSAQVILPTSLEARTEMISHIVRILYYLLQMRNLNSARMVISALDCQSVFRLRETWKTFENVDRNKYRLLESTWITFNAKKDWQNYRNVLAHMILYTSFTKPCIPFFGFILHEAITNRYKEIYGSGSFLSSENKGDSRQLNMFGTPVGEDQIEQENDVDANPHMLYHRQQIKDRENRPVKKFKRISLLKRSYNKPQTFKNQPKAIMAAVVGLLQCKRFANLYDEEWDKHNIILRYVIRSCPIYNEYDLYLLSLERE